MPESLKTRIHREVVHTSPFYSKSVKIDALFQSYLICNLTKLFESCGNWKDQDYLTYEFFVPILHVLAAV